ncbi:hypothetical protein MKA58_09335 [[Clostridium] innocuum]|nr:hypothetical protein [[Clostridium] innocuum]
MKLTYERLSAIIYNIVYEEVDDEIDDVEELMEYLNDNKENCVEVVSL